MVSASPLPVVDELSVVLPQRHRARVLKVRPYRDHAILILLQDFVRVGPGRGRGVAFNGLDPRWRLFIYTLHDRSAREICTLTHPPANPLGTVHMTSCGEPIFLLFHAQLMRVDISGSKVEEVCDLKLPEAAADEPEHVVRAFASGSTEFFFTLTSGEEDLLLYRVPLDDKPTTGTRFPGARGDRLAVGPNGDLYAVDLLDLYHYEKGTLKRTLDVSGHFQAWSRSPIELLTVASDGRVLVGSGDRLLVLSPGLDEVLGMHQLPIAADDIVWADAQERLMLSKVDRVESTLLVQSVVL